VAGAEQPPARPAPAGTGPDHQADPREERRQRRHEKTRREILRAAREVLLEAGTDGLTLRDVAQRADFSPAALYKYFSGRDEIIAALTMESFEILAGFIDAVPLRQRPDRRLVSLGLAYLKFAEENPADLRCILDATMRPLPASVDLSTGLRAVEALHETLLEGVGKGIFRDLSESDLAGVAYGLWALVHGMTTLRGADLGTVRRVVRPDARRALTIYVDGLRRPPS